MKPKIKAPAFEYIRKTLQIVNTYGVNTVCYSSKCPNLTECFERGVATFLILGNICTRNCRFCNIKHSKPLPPDDKEPQKTAEAVKALNLNYAVITSVDRDDLSDYGSLHFFDTVKEIHKLSPKTKTELLTPDFRGDISALNIITASYAYKLAHNIDVVESLHKKIKPSGNYSLSLKVLEYYSKFKITKSSLIVGFGETMKEIRKTLKDLKNSGVTQVTVGQYLQPSQKHYPVKKEYSQNEFEEIKSICDSLGFESFAVGKLVRSSYYADIL